MKKLLFIMNNLNCGGAEKALISLLETIDYSKYEIDLFLFKHEGVFMSKIPSEVTLLSEAKYYKYFDMSIKKAVIDLIKEGKISIALARILSIYIFKTEKSRAVTEQRVWKYLSKAFSKLDKEYDVAIGYLEKNPIYFCVDKVKAKKKIGWIHNDYEKLGMDKDIDVRYFNKLNYVFTVSEECLNVLNKVFPQYSNKNKLMYNIVSSKTINKLALEEVTDVDFKQTDINIISVGRLNYQKGFEMAIEACSILVNKGYKIKWNILGEGADREKLQKLINDLEIGKNFKLLGIKENPYPYIRRSDIYVQPSRFEGKSIAIDEAKILNKPIVVTNFSTVKDQIEDKVNGLICDMNSMDLADKIEELIVNRELKEKLSENLSKERLGNECEINKIYEVI